jgi:hypothetical protein
MMLGNGNPELKSQALLKAQEKSPFGEEFSPLMVMFVSPCEGSKLSLKTPGCVETLESETFVPTCSEISETISTNLIRRGIIG